MKARELIVAPRMPRLNADTYTGNPFTSPGDVVADCDVVDEKGNRCGYHVMGPREDVKKAMTDHRNLYHSTTVSVVLLNQPNQ